MISQVNMQIMAGDKPREIWFLFETDFADLSELNDELAKNGLVYGNRIETASAGSGQRRELSRYEFILGKSAVLSIAPPRDELLPPEAAQVEPA